MKAPEHILAMLLLTAMGCENKPAPPAPEPAPVPSAAPAASPVLAVESAPSVTAATTAAPSTSAASPAPTHAVVAHAASSKVTPTSSAAPAPEPAPAPAKSASKHVTGKNFGIDLASSGCHAATECAITIKLVAAGDFHVNKEYPYKFTGAPAPNVTFSKGDFTRAAGDFAEQGEKTGVMTVRFKPASAGDVNVSGTYKMSVCNADQCQIETQALDLVVPVM